MITDLPRPLRQACFTRFGDPPGSWRCDWCAEDSGSTAEDRPPWCRICGGGAETLILNLRHENSETLKKLDDIRVATEKLERKLLSLVLAAP